MSQFVFLYRMSPNDRPSPREMQQRMEVWMEWMSGLEAKGHIVSMGEPLEPDGALVSKSGVTDGPFAEAKDVVMGFTLIRAKNLGEAKKLAAGCPIVPSGGGVVEVRPVRMRVG